MIFRRVVRSQKVFSKIVVHIPHDGVDVIRPFPVPADVVVFDQDLLSTYSGTRRRNRVFCSAASGPTASPCIFSRRRGPFGLVMISVGTSTESVAAARCSSVSE